VALGFFASTLDAEEYSVLPREDNKWWRRRESNPRKY